MMMMEEDESQPKQEDEGGEGGECMQDKVLVVERQSGLTWSEPN